MKSHLTQNLFIEEFFFSTNMKCGKGVKTGDVVNVLSTQKHKE